jgi:anti-sigma regulatory factor (Ser/Thr protein kinase)
MNGVRLALSRSEFAPRQARRAVARWLVGVGCPEETKGDVLLVVSELVTNAVTHAHAAPIVEASFDDGRLRLEVHDTDPAPPTILPVSGPHGGYGLRIVACLCDAWGWTAMPEGKRVWTETLC